MLEWLKSLLTAVGGGTVVLVRVCTIFKGLMDIRFERLGSHHGQCSLRVALL